MGGGGIPEGVPGEHPEMSAEALAAGAAEGAQKVRTNAQSRLRNAASMRPNQVPVGLLRPGILDVVVSDVAES